MTHATLERALREIARLGPTSEPGDQEHDGLEEAEAHGLRLGQWEAAVIARRALAEYLNDHLNDCDQVAYADLTDAERGQLQALNRALAEVEVHLHRTAAELRRQLEAMKADPDSGLDDYEIELEVGLHPPDGDPSWDDDDVDNRIGELTERLTAVKDSPTFGFGAVQINHAEPGWFPGEHHSWLYHCAYDHSGLGWRELLRVGLLWADLVVTRQSVFRVPRPDSADGTQGECTETAPTNAGKSLAGR
ncbi:MAG: hypothetical protein WCJ64_26160 [Rhodospirillaceae bacterium]